MPKETILIVDDEPAIRDLLEVALEIAGFKSLQAENAPEAHAMIVDQKPDLVLLDWMMPGTSGLELARRLKQEELTRRIPIIMLTAKAEEDNTVQGLTVGADDYVSKPFSPRELIARIKSVLRRTAADLSDKSLQIDKLVLNPETHRVTINARDIHVGPTEYRLLEFFMTHQERVYSRAQLLDHVWGSNVYVEERTVDVHIRRLRKAIAQEGQERFIQTVRGSGYRFSTSDTVPSESHAK